MDMSNDFFAKAIGGCRRSKGPALTRFRTRGNRADTRGPVKSGDSADGRLDYEDAADGASRQGNCSLGCVPRQTNWISES
jgi:hypothetical protein